MGIEILAWEIYAKVDTIFFESTFYAKGFMG